MFRLHEPKVEMNICLARREKEGSVYERNNHGLSKQSILEWSG